MNNSWIRRNLRMFTRALECEAKVGKKDELTNRVITDVLPILQNQHGFVDYDCAF